jgi:hypothetical protein
LRKLSLLAEQPNLPHNHVLGATTAGAGLGSAVDTHHL